VNQVQLDAVEEGLAQAAERGKTDRRAVAAFVVAWLEKAGYRIVRKPGVARLKGGETR
jgi:hypothetical protein